MTSDGSIVFEASINDKNAQTKLNQLKDKIQRLQNSLEKSTGEQSNIKKKLDSAKAAAQETEKEIKRIILVGLISMVYGNQMMCTLW